MKARFSAPAKVNLILRVVGQRPDGYHLLQTVMTFFPLFDFLEFERLDADSGIYLACQPEVTASPEENLACKGAKALQMAAGTDKGVRIHLIKNIPHGGGLGGGSSDAATVLLALNQLWNLNWTRDQLIELGVGLGADVPIFLGGEAALAEGVGERLSFLPRLPTAVLVLLNPGLNISTAEVFSRLAGRFPLHSHPLTPASVMAGEVVALLENDLEPVVRQMTPVIAEMAAALKSTGAVATLMSGSGASLFGVFQGEKQADQAVTILKERYSSWKVSKGQTFNIHPFANEMKSGIVRGL
ncbi:MAG: 4-(cytidine 5'-diphospho)-2-C-methyl-D-erythritol kinase [Magnetococcales bacterium]|nr:4-(cytidine 5'-diphospho)-2-C-methyl-D-erythritol kinase [Magnetococcales bacterium]